MNQVTVAFKALIMALSNHCRQSSLSGLNLSLGQATTKANSVVKTTTIDRTAICILTLGAQGTLKSNSDLELPASYRFASKMIYANFIFSGHTVMN